MRRRFPRREVEVILKKWTNSEFNYINSVEQDCIADIFPQPKKKNIFLEGSMFFFAIA